MKITIINGTNRIGNESMKITLATEKIAQELGFETAIITLENFDQLFRGTYITLDNATHAQKADIEKMMNADFLLFVIPTYHSGMPSSLKNFFDTLKVNQAYERKVIGVISSNDSNKDLGARMAVQVIHGVLAFRKLISFVLPQISIINFEDIDRERIRKYLEYCVEFAKRV